MIMRKRMVVNSSILSYTYKQKQYDVLGCSCMVDMTAAYKSRAKEQLNEKGEGV
jgi:hypothetical protein